MSDGGYSEQSGKNMLNLSLTGSDLEPTSTEIESFPVL
jgi:hypothetical protein